jgi:hypothetical protein
MKYRILAVVVAMAAVPILASRSSSRAAHAGTAVPVQMLGEGGSLGPGPGGDITGAGGITGTGGDTGPGPSPNPGPGAGGETGVGGEPGTGGTTGVGGTYGMSGVERLLDDTIAVPSP